MCSKRFNIYKSCCVVSTLEIDYSPATHNVTRCRCYLSLDHSALLPVATNNPAIWPLWPTRVSNKALPTRGTCIISWGSSREIHNRWMGYLQRQCVGSHGWTQPALQLTLLCYITSYENYSSCFTIFPRTNIYLYSQRLQ